MSKPTLAITASAARVWQAVGAGRLSRPVPRLLDTEAAHLGHVELTRLLRYVGVLLVVGLCLLVNAWTRIDMRQTSVELHRAAQALESARAERARLELELATLVDPLRLDLAAQTQGLVPVTTTILVPAP